MLIDYRTSDDAGVFLLRPDCALVQTVDFFTPVVDDPFAYGQIAAANSLSDVYAMGGRPLTALAVAAFPKGADRAVLRAIMAGGLSKLREASVALLGGHTVQDDTIKFGYAVTGEVDPGRLWSNAAVRPDDDLVLTKPIGTGVIATALKSGRAPEAAVAAAIAAMSALNRVASEVLHGLPDGAVHACTDVTGFGLIGHAFEMAAGSGCTIELEGARVPLLEGARALVAENTPGGARTNVEHFARHVRTSAGIDAELLQLLYDPQTSGGLLVAIDRAQTAPAVMALTRAGVAAVHVGRATTSAEPAIVIK